jgi:quinohemoprotein ethanol dehydrogenase
MSAATHQTFNAIVLEGTLAARGMPGYADILTSEQADAIHAHLIGVAQRAYENQQQIE